MAPPKKFLLRINPDLWDELSRWAADDLRSINAQIEFLLRDAVKKRRGQVRPDAGEPGGMPDSPPKK